MPGCQGLTWVLRAWHWCSEPGVDDIKHGRGTAKHGTGSVSLLWVLPGWHGYCEPDRGGTSLVWVP